MKPHILIIGTGKQANRYASTIERLECATYESLSPRHTFTVNTSVSGVIVAAHPVTNRKAVEMCVKYNIPILLEKPVSLMLSDILEISDMAKQIPILVNYIQLFSPAYQKLKARMLPGTTERDYSQLYDYGPHILAMALDLGLTNVVEKETDYLKPMENLITHFMDIIENGVEPSPSFDLTVKIHRILNAIDKSQ